MQLSSFITSHREQVLEAWERNALSRSILPNGSSYAPLRDHLGELLEAIALDIDASRDMAASTEDQAASRRHVPNVTAIAAKHGAGRAHAGIPLKQMVPEFPALRSCVARLWLESLSSPSPRDLEDLLHFDEALDRALTLSVSEFVDRLDRSRETFLGILGHDLRDPLSTIITAAKLLRDERLEETRMREVASRIASTGTRMHQLVVDLLDFTRTRVGGQMPIKPHEGDLGQIVRSVCEEFTTAHPRREVHVHISGDLRGRWDDVRMSQAVGNLLANAFHHGAADRPIDISTSTDETSVAIAIHNEGPPIPDERREHLFEPFQSATVPRSDREPTHIGLGLYIAKAIAGGHGGHIEVESSAERGTTFTMRLPRGGAGTSASER